MKKIYSLLLLVLLALPVSLATFNAQVARAATGDSVLNNLQSFGGTSGYVTAGYDKQGTFLDTMIGRIVSIVLGLLGIIFFVIILYAGLLWMTSGGDEKKVAKARQLIITSSIGLGVILAAATITWFIINQLNIVTSGGI